MVLLIIPGIIGMVVCLFLLLIKAFTKKPKKKTVIAFVIFFAMCVVAISSIDDSGSEEPTPTTPATIEATVAQEVTEPATNPPTEPKTEATISENEQETASKESTVNLWKIMVEMSASGNYDYCEVNADETGAMIYLATNGFAEVLAQAKAYGLDETYEGWQTAKKSMVDLNKVLCESAENLGLDDFPVMLILVSDLNHDDMLLIIKNDEVIFDCMAN